MLETPAGPRLDEVALNFPYAKPVLDSIYLSRQPIGARAAPAHLEFEG